eukprot:scaffold245776_cov18-Prasinocladus_malaysianus.AAC.1
MIPIGMRFVRPTAKSFDWICFFAPIAYYVWAKRKAEMDATGCSVRDSAQACIVPLCFALI